VDAVRQCKKFLNFDLPIVKVANAAAKYESQFTANCSDLYCS